MKKINILLFVLVLATGCNINVDKMLFDVKGERLKIDKISTKEKFYSEELKLELTAEEPLTVWNVMDIKYEGDPKLTYYIEFTDEDGVVSYFNFDALKLSKIAKSGYKILGKNDWKLKGKLGVIKVGKSGIYSIKAFLSSNSKKTIELRKAEIVFDSKTSK